MATLPSMSSKRTLCGDRQTIQFIPKDWISIGNKINCQLKLFYLQSRFSLFMLVIDCHLSACGWAWTTARCWHVMLGWPTPLVGCVVLIDEILVWPFLYLGYLVTTHWQCDLVICELQKIRDSILPAKLVPYPFCATCREKGCRWEYLS